LLFIWGIIVLYIGIHKIIQIFLHLEVEKKEVVKKKNKTIRAFSKRREGS